MLVANAPGCPCQAKDKAKDAAAGSATAMAAAAVSVKLDKPLYFLNACPALVEREGIATLVGEAATPLYRQGQLKGCTMVRATKIPAGLGSFAHDGSVGGYPHNYFHLGFTGVSVANDAFCPSACTAISTLIFQLAHPLTTAFARGGCSVRPRGRTVTRSTARGSKTSMSSRESS